MTDPISLTISEEADNAAEAFIGSAIRNWNIAQFGESNKRDLNILLRDDDGTVTGGLMGHTARGGCSSPCSSCRKRCVVKDLPAACSFWRKKKRADAVASAR